MECPVCCVTYTKIQRRRIACVQCSYECCAACVRQYILQSSHDADCMSCHRPVDREFLTTNLTRAFVDGDYKRHREEVLVEREIALLPSSQHLVKNYRLAERLKEQLRQADLRIVQVQDELDRLRNGRDSTRDRIARIVRSGFNSSGAFRDVEDAAERERRAFVRACPSSECRGFLSSQLKCGTCDSWACPECNECLGTVKDAPHTCDPANVATARLLRRDTKACPRCATPIYKIDGCDQMFCTQCHVAFSWRSGRIENGTVHNPHYYAWLRSRSANGDIPRNPGDDPMQVCGGAAAGADTVPGVWQVDRVLRAHGYPPEDILSQRIMSYHREVRHIQFVEMPRVRVADHTPDEITRDLRLKYLLNLVDRDEFKRQLVIREKSRAKRQELRQIYDTFVAVAADILRGLTADVRAAQTPPPDALLELRAIAEHSNAALEQVTKQYGSAFFRVTVV